MKAYVCDLCNRVIKDPHKMNMREFYVGASFECDGVFSKNSKIKQKIHFCGDCFEKLRIAATKEIETEDTSNDN